MKKILNKTKYLIVILTAITVFCAVGLLCLNLYKKSNDAVAYTDPASSEVSKKIAEEGLILLRNENGCLPLTSSMKVGGFGSGQSSDYQYGGGGSGNVYSKTKISPKVGLDNAVSQGRIASYTQMNGATGGSYDRVLFFITRYSAEDSDLVESNYYLTATEKSNLTAICNNYGANKVVAIINAPSVIDTTYLIEKGVGAIVCDWMAGEQAGNALANNLTGIVNPSGKTTDTWAKSLDDYPTTANFSNPIAINYTEDLYVGYRYFETFDPDYQKVNYCFGYGLSYTTFSISVLSVNFNKTEDKATVKVTVKNTGNKYYGKEVVQVYFSTPNKTLDTPAKQLIAFKKTKSLAPNESETLTLTFNISEMKQFDDLGIIADNSYVLQKGDYKIYVGNSVKNAGERGVRATYTQTEHKIIETCNPVTTNLESRLTSNGTIESLADYKDKTNKTTHYISGYGATYIDAVDVFETRKDFYKNADLRGWYNNWSSFSYFVGLSSNKFLRHHESNCLDKIRYKLYVEKAGTYNVDFILSNTGASSSDLFRVELDYTLDNVDNGTDSGIRIALNNTGNYDSWRTNSVMVSGNTVTFDRTGYVLFTVKGFANTWEMDYFTIYNNKLSDVVVSELPAESLTGGSEGIIQETNVNGLCVGNLVAGRYIEYTVNAEKAGVYYVGLYASSCYKASDDIASVYVNGNLVSGKLALKRTAGFPFDGAMTDSWWAYENSGTVTVTLNAGTNVIRFSINRFTDYYDGANYCTFLNVHKIIITPQNLGKPQYNYYDNTAEYNEKSVNSPYSFDRVYTYQDVVEGNISIRDFVRQLNVYEMAGLATVNYYKNIANTGVGGIGGFPNMDYKDNPSNPNYIDSVYNYCKTASTVYKIPYSSVSDGPAGVRFIQGDYTTDDFRYSTYFPCMTMLASTWNTDLAYEFGIAYGKEANAVGISVMLTPGVNIHRNPLCGRNFEYMSEDPFVAGWIATGIINGCHRSGVTCSIKHFATNNQETARFMSDSRVSARALRQIYLKAFEIAIKNANPGTVMTSYNYLNGVADAENGDLGKILRNEWGYKGFVESDWGAWHYIATNGILAGTTNAISDGNSPLYVKEIVDAYRFGEISYDVLAKNTEYLINTLITTNTSALGTWTNAPTMGATQYLTCSDGAGITYKFMNTQNTQRINSETAEVSTNLPNGIYGTAKLETHEDKTYLSNLDAYSGAFYTITVEEEADYNISYLINVMGYEGQYGNFRLYIDGVLADVFTNPSKTKTAVDWYGTGVLTGDDGAKRVHLDNGLHRIFIKSGGQYYNLHKIYFNSGVTVTLLNADGSENSSTKINQGETFVFPNYTSSEIFVGWQYNGELYNAGDTLVISQDVVAVAKTISFVTETGARLRLADTISASGIRFEFKFDTAQFNEIGASVIEYGAIISPKDIVGSKEFVLENFVVGSSIIKVVADAEKSQTSGNFTLYHVAITNIKFGNYNRGYCARGYIKIRFSDGETKYFYTNFSVKNNTRSASYIANYFRMFDTENYNKLYPYQKEIIDAYAYYYVAEKEIELPMI